MNNNTIKESQEASEKDGNPPSSTGDFSDSKSTDESGKPSRQKENKSKDNKNKKPNKKHTKKVKIPWKNSVGYQYNIIEQGRKWAVEEKSKKSENFLKESCRKSV